MPRPTWMTDVLIVAVFAVILAVLSVVNIRTLNQTYEQTERIQTVNQFVDCLDPTTSCGVKLAAFNEAERVWLAETMQSQAICTLLTSRSVVEETDMAQLEQVYNECVAARTRPQPVPPESPVEKVEKEKRQ